MPMLEIARCTLTIETTPPLSQYGWIARGVSTHYCLPFRSSNERAHFLRLLAAYVGLAASATDAIDDIGALLCLYHGVEEAAAHLAAHHLDADYADLLVTLPLDGLDVVVNLLLEEAAVAERGVERDTEAHPTMTCGTPRGGDC